MTTEYIKPHYERCFPLAEPRNEEWVTRHDDWITAIHEAAHAVIGYQNGLKVEEIWLRKDGTRKSNGYVMIPTEQDDLSENKQGIAMLMAGNIAENIETRPVVWHRAGSDEKKALTLIFELLDDGDEDFDHLVKERRHHIALTYRDECFRKTIQDVMEPHTWRMIRSMAATIYRHRVLRFSALRVILYRLAQLTSRTPPVISGRVRTGRPLSHTNGAKRGRLIIRPRRGLIRSGAFNDYLCSKRRTIGRVVCGSADIQAEYDGMPSP